jgi:serine/threonine protein phosphatase PrpC
MPLRITVYGQTDVGLVRPNNEDAFVIADLTHDRVVEAQRLARFEIGEAGVLLAVSDGMGGHKAGEVASAIVVDSLRRALMSRAGSATRDEVLVEQATKQANREVWEAAHEAGRERMGATLTGVLVRGTMAHIAEVGDSRAYLLRNGAIEQVTRDQSFVQQLIDKGAMPEAEAEQSPFSNVILQAMGLRPDVKVALGRLGLRRRDCLILCSDGLSKKVSPEDMRAIVLGSPHLDAACGSLVETAKKRGGEDNITVIAAGVSGDLPQAGPGETIGDTLQILQEFDAPLSSPGG